MGNPFAVEEKVRMLCHACRTAMQAEDRFCAGCGAPVQRPSHRLPAETPASELKYVTLLRADLVNSTGLVAGLGPEQAVARVAPSLAAMAEAVRQFGGIVAKELGDGLLAVFGAPRADDHHATLACHAAIDLVRRIGNLGDDALQVRVGLHSGVVVARVSTTEFSSVYDFVGPALILVERLQAAAEPGRIYASAACRDLAEGYIAFDCLTPRPLKGFPDPVPLFRAAGIGALSSWRVRAARTLSRFVGRASEIAALAQAAATVSTEAGQTVALIGDPGVGKSRLVHEFLHGLREEGWRVIEAECSPTAEAFPYALLESLVGTVAAAPVAEPPDAGLPPLWRAALDALRDLPVDDAEWNALEPRPRARATADACRAVIEKAIGGKRTVLLIEDLQWLDAASNEAVETLISLAARQPLLLLFTSRPHAAPAWLGGRNALQLRLRPLDDGAARTLLEALLGRFVLVPAVTRRLLRHAGGVPLFLEELCRQLRETGAGALDQSFDALAVPATIQGVIAARIDRLAKPDRALLQLAAALGPRSTVGVLRGLAALPEELLRQRLRALDAAELLVEASLLPSHAYEFSHDLIRQVTYDAMLEPVRVQLHQEILAALEADAEARIEDQIAMLCHHAVRAKEWQKSYRYAHSMAQKCLARSALSDAVNYFEIAMDALDRISTSREREERAIDLRVEGGLACARFGRVDRLLELAEEAEQRAAAIGDGPRRVAALAVLAGAMNFYRNPLAAITAGEQVLLQAEELGDFGWLNYAEYILGQAYFVAGRGRDAERMFGRAHARLSGPAPRAPAGMTVRGLMLLCCMMKCAAHITLGELEPAGFFQQRAQEIATDSQRPYDLVAVAYSGGMYLLGRGDFAEAQARLEAALDLAQLRDVRLFMPVIALQLGIAYLELGLFEQARHILRRAKSEAEGVGHATVVPSILTHLALAVYHCGKVRAALHLVRAARNIARQQGFAGVEAEALFFEAKIMVSRLPSDRRHAISCLHQSITIASRIEANEQRRKSAALLRQVIESSDQFHVAV
jgi:class 3 adenylate cyclase/tetratricopeptide (TPR) repeat protein